MVGFLAANEAIEAIAGELPTVVEDGKIAAGLVAAATYILVNA